MPLSFQRRSHAMQPTSSRNCAVITQWSVLDSSKMDSVTLRSTGQQCGVHTALNNSACVTAQLYEVAPSLWSPDPTHCVPIPHVTLVSRNHRWFQGFDWEGLRNRTAVPPIIPNVSTYTYIAVLVLVWSFPTIAIPLYHFSLYPPHLSPGPWTCWSLQFWSL